MFFGVSSSVTECFQSVTDYLQPVTELETPKNIAAALPGMTLQPLYYVMLLPDYYDVLEQGNKKNPMKDVAVDNPHYDW